MKRFTSLESARKSIIIQTVCLFAGLLVVCFAARLITHSRFTNDLPAAYGFEDLKTSDVTIGWSGEEIPVEDYEIRHVTLDDGDVTVLRITMRPEKAGIYRMLVYDSEGAVLSEDEIHVDDFRTAFSYSTGRFTGCGVTVLSMLLFVAGLFVIMLAAWLRLKGPLANSCEAIFTCGVFILAGTVLCFALPYYYRHLSNPIAYEIWQFVLDFAGVGRKISARTLPAVVIFSILLIISNTALLRHERPRFRNVLGILLGMILIGAGVGSYAVSRKITGSDATWNTLRRFAIAENTIGLAFAYGECILLSTIICGIRAAKHMPEMDRDYILILGCGFRKDGTLTPLLKGRVDRALEFWRRQKEKTGKAAVVIPSGGQGKNEPMPEAEAMSRYIAETGFPGEYVIPENRSANTYQNMEFSRDIIDGRDPDSVSAKVCYVTTNYHVFRSGIYANRVGLTAEGLGARTRWWFWPNAYIRECVGFFSNKALMILYLVVLGVTAVVTMQLTDLMF